MEKIIKSRQEIFKNYCLKNTSWLDKFTLPIIQRNQKKEAILIEFRELDHLYFLIKNTIRVLGEGWSHTIVCGNQNYNFILNIINRIGRNIKIIRINKDNITRLEYSLMLIESNFYKMFKGDYLLIYQEDTIIFRNIPEYYFNYDFVGAPIPNKPKKFNGGLSLRNKNKMIEICQVNFDKMKDQYGKCRDFLESYDINYKKEPKYIFLYLIEKNLLEDLLLVEYCNKIPTFMEAREFSVEKYFFKNPIGGHQFWYCVKDINLWLDVNLKKY